MKSETNYLPSPYLLGKILYALLFVGFVPALLWLWVEQTGTMVTLPAVHAPAVGLATSIAGLLLLLWGMFSLKKFGHGLPMNAFPPERFVQKGAFRLFSHPIYVGFGLLCVGISVALGSASGQYLVAPIAILSMAALVLGYEGIALRQRFPDAVTSAVFPMPPDSPAPATRLEGLAVMTGIFLWGLLANGLLWQINGEPFLDRSHGIQFGFSLGFFVLYCLALIFLLLQPLGQQSKSGLRALAISMFTGIFLTTFLGIVAPGVGMGYFHASGVLNPAWFSVPAGLILIAGQYYTKFFPKMRGIVIFSTLVFAFVAVVFSAGPLSHFIAAIFIYWISANLAEIWDDIRLIAENIANSWKEWVFGPVRVINHGFYVGIAAFLGAVLIGVLSGVSYTWAILEFGVIGVVSAGLWAQFVEGSEKLKRPFGYYGSLVGAIIGFVLLRAQGYDAWLLIGSFSVAMPWVQAIGRLRCLVNGCCHGSPTNEMLGIHYHHPRSRVCGLSHLKNVPLHPTQVYSIIWLFFVGLLLLRLWFGAMSYPFIFGIYLILTGIGRFVEEAFRGEVQTPIFWGLRLYQWTAIATVLIGMVLTMIPLARTMVPLEFSWEIIGGAALLGFFTFFAMGVDFPNSNVRFSRLV